MISKELISILFHPNEIRLHNTDTSPRFYWSFYSPKMTPCRPFHSLTKWSQGWPQVTEGQEPFCGREKLCSPTATLGENSRVHHFNRSEANGKGNAATRTSHLAEPTSSSSSPFHRLPTACAPVRQEFQDPSVTSGPRVSGYHTSLDAFGLRGKSACKILSRGIQLKENSRMSSLLAF